MPKHSLNALLGFGRNLSATLSGHYDLFLTNGADLRPRVSSLEELGTQMLNADQDAKKYRILHREKAAEARRLKKEYYSAGSNLVDMGSGLAGKHSPLGQEIRRHRKTLRRRRAPRGKNGAAA